MFYKIWSVINVKFISLFLFDTIKRMKWNGIYNYNIYNDFYDANIKVWIRYKNYLIEYLENLMENRSISVVKNYAIISYDGTYENAIEELNRKSMSFKGNLLRAKIVCEILNEDEIKNLIYRELNKNSSQNISKLQGGGKNLYVGEKQKAKRN